MTDNKLIYPARERLAQLPTPLVPMDRLSEELQGPRIWLKRDDLSEGAAAGNKIRKLEFSFAEAKKQGCDIVITCGGVQSNHCRATAILARQLGMDCHLVLRGESPPTADGNLLLDQLVGAEISYLSMQAFSGIDEYMTKLQQDYANNGKIAYCIPVGASDATGLWGYIAASGELAKDFEEKNIQPSHIFSATGSGGTLGGLILGSQLFNQSWTAVAVNVSDDRKYFENKILHDIQLWTKKYPETAAQLQHEITPEDIHIIEGFKAPGYGKAPPAVYDLIKWLGKLEGILLDPVYTGKAFLGMVNEIRNGKFKNAQDLVFIHTGGIFGNFPLKAGFQ